VRRAASASTACAGESCKPAVVSNLRTGKEKECPNQNLLAAALQRRLQRAWQASGCSARPQKSADAYQGNMERALSSLNEAFGSLRESTANKGKHRARAMDLVRQAIDETQAGIAFADEHGGGGANLIGRLRRPAPPSRHAADDRPK
jgi:hypothetical protein